MFVERKKERKKRREVNQSSQLNFPLFTFLFSHTFFFFFSKNVFFPFPGTLPSVPFVHLLVPLSRNPTLYLYPTPPQLPPYGTSNLVAPCLATWIYYYFSAPCSSKPSSMKKGSYSSLWLRLSQSALAYTLRYKMACPLCNKQTIQAHIRSIIHNQKGLFKKHKESFFYEFLRCCGWLI